MWKWLLVRLPDRSFDRLIQIGFDIAEWFEDIRFERDKRYFSDRPGDPLFAGESKRFSETIVKHFAQHTDEIEKDRWSEAAKLITDGDVRFPPFDVVNGERVYRR